MAMVSVRCGDGGGEWGVGRGRGGVGGGVRGGVRGRVRGRDRCGFCNRASEVAQPHLVVVLGTGK